MVGQRVGIEGDESAGAGQDRAKVTDLGQPDAHDHKRSMLSNTKRVVDLQPHTTTHARYYSDFVFNWKAFHGIGLKRGHFIEDILGQKYKTDIRTHGWRKCQHEYGTWILTAAPPVDGKEVPVLTHIDGRRYLDRAVVSEKYKVERAQHLLRQQLRKGLSIS